MRNYKKKKPLDKLKILNKVLVLLKMREIDM